MAYQRRRCLILDSNCNTLADGEMLGRPDASEFKVFISDDQIGAVLQHEVIQLIGLENGTENLVGRIVRKGDDYIIMGDLQLCGDMVLQNLRVPVQADTFIYPLSGAWSGRRPARSYDLSCGGIAFFCSEEFRRGERVEIVVPTLSNNPLVLECEILRRRPDSSDLPLYAAKFINLCNDEERLIREKVFQIQLEQRSSLHKPESL